MDPPKPITATKIKLSTQVARVESRSNNTQQQSQLQTAPSIRSDAILPAETANLTLQEICSSSYYRKVANKLPKKKKSDSGEPQSADESNPKGIGGSNKGNSKSNSSKASKISAINLKEKRKFLPELDSNQPRSFGPKLELINGRMQIRDPNNDPNRENRGRAGNYDEDDNDVDVEEGIDTNNTTYSSYVKRRRTQPWGIQETWSFFQALGQCGTDFSMMQSFFPGRTRAELKKKFNREERSRPELVKTALSSTVPLDMSVYELQFGALKGDSFATPSAAVNPTVAGSKSKTNKTSIGSSSSNSSSSSSSNSSCSSENNNKSNNEHAKTAAYNNILSVDETDETDVVV